jgi:hypothetical protein
MLRDLLTFFVRSKVPGVLFPSVCSTLECRPGHQAPGASAHVWNWFFHVIVYESVDSVWFM